MGLGYLRLFLAGLVALSHYPGTFRSVDLGASAVIGFYFVSGYLMRVSFERFSGGPRPAARFYLDRALRIVPCFLLTFAATLALAALGALPEGLFAGFNFSQGLLELLILPQGLFHLVPGVTQRVVPTAWSLGVELQWYLLVPFYFRIPTRLKILAVGLFGVGHLAVLTPTLWGITQAHCQWPTMVEKCLSAPHLFGYRLFGFVGVVFLLGDLVAQFRRRAEAQWMIWATVLTLYGGCYFVVSQITRDVRLPIALEVLIGVLVFVPWAGSVLARPLEGRLKRWDGWLGEFSYPIFLTHFLALWLASPQGHVPNRSLIFYFGLTLLLSAVLVWVQRRVDRFRYGMRGFARAGAP